MILQRTRPPLLETPFEVFDRGVFTPNDQFFVRWHWAVIPQQIDVATFRWPCAATSTPRSRCRSPTSSRCRGSRWRRSISAPAIPAASLRRASPAANGRTAPWAMPLDRRAAARHPRPRRRKAGRRRCPLQRLGRAGGRGRTGLSEIARHRPRPRRRGHAGLPDERRRSCRCSTASRCASSCRAGIRPIGSRCSTTSRCSTRRTTISG